MAYGLWGLMPLYFQAMKAVPPMELLLHRIVWSALLLMGVITVMQSWPEVTACFRKRSTFLLLLLSTLLIALNWFTFIYGVWAEQVVQNSLGYFINPLVNIVLGMLVFGERLRRLQWVAVGFAGLGVVYLIVSLGEIPWISLTLALSFGGYGLIRKVAPVNALIGLTVETLILTPAAAVILLIWYGQSNLGFGKFGMRVDGLILASGVITAVPLLFFGEAARRLRLSTLGFLQYIAPTCQFLLAVLYLREPFRSEQQVSFALIWSALVIVSADTLWRKARVPIKTVEGASG
jgi:chloramphenicol-sensitive protein RarD